MLVWPPDTHEVPRSQGGVHAIARAEILLRSVCVPGDMLSIHGPHACDAAIGCLSEPLHTHAMALLHRCLIEMTRMCTAHDSDAGAA